MTNKLIYKTVKKLAPLYQSQNQYSDFDGIFKTFTKDYRTFFEHLSPESFYNLFAFAYFLWIENPDYTLEEIEERLPNTGFVFTYSNDYEDIEETCGNCDGDGEVDCDNCEDGQVTCPSCDGEGVDDEGDTCEECNGSGEIECTWCHGTGQETCDVCDGSGEVENDYEVMVSNTATFFSEPGQAEYFQKALQKDLDVEEELPLTTIYSEWIRESLRFLEAPSGQEILVKEVNQDFYRLGELLIGLYLGRRQKEVLRWH
jgi:hypothetical protein